MKRSIGQRFRNALDAFRQKVLEPVGSAWLSLANAIGDHFSGAWQQVAGPPDADDIQDGISVAVVYDCIRRISTDIAKMSPGIRRLTASGAWKRDTHQTLAKLLRRPNHFQNWFQFIVCWVCSKLIAGNTYVIKLYQGTSVSELIVLDPTKVTPLVDRATGNVFYRITTEALARVAEDMLVAASDMIHDRCLPMGHPLIGTAPLDRAIVGSKARQGILQNTASLNEATGVPPGILFAPEGQTPEQLKELADRWRGIPKGRIAVVDASFKFESLAAKYVDSQSVEIAELSGTDVCIAFGMPPWKLGFGTRPTGNPEALQVVYFQDTLQWLKEEIEQCLDHGLDVAADVYVELDPSSLLMMDSVTRATVHAILIKGIMAPNEARLSWDLPPTAGGDTVYMQQQNYSLAALHARDLAGPPPSATAAPPASGGPQEDPVSDDGDANEAEARAPSLPWAGVYDAAREYHAGQFATHQGKLWYALENIPLDTKPGTGPQWALVDKRDFPVEA